MAEVKNTPYHKILGLPTPNIVSDAIPFIGEDGMNLYIPAVDEQTKQTYTKRIFIKSKESEELEIWLNFYVLKTAYRDDGTIRYLSLINLKYFPEPEDG